MPTCVRCLLPSVVPGADLDAAGVCALCRVEDTSDPAAGERQRLAFASDLEQTIEACRGRAAYDCLACFSGGKDSIYMLYKLKKELGLKVLAFTCDLDIPPAGWDNIHRTIDGLDVDHVTFRPPMGFYRKFFAYLLRNQDARGAVRTVCYVSAPLTEGYALRLATEKGIPVVFAGYSPGQPDPDWMLYEMPRRKISEFDWTPSVLRDSGLFSASELALFWNPRQFPEGTGFPRYIAPFHAWEYDQLEVIRTVQRLGFVARRRNANPIFSNSPFQWLLMYSDLKNLGYNPYAPEFSTLIRRGKASRLMWRVAFPLVDAMIRHRVLLGAQVTRSAREFGVRIDEMAITRPTPPDDYQLFLEQNPAPPARAESGAVR
ncbi:MAG: hypothetical protein MUF10_00230 [Thermoanaerobaculaceae bacterium]|jgi:hypothetical protein|nr:hypothetical protein [Thermoanaerobaculaceae bacterium]